MTPPTRSAEPAARIEPARAQVNACHDRQELVAIINRCIRAWCGCTYDEMSGMTHAKSGSSIAEGDSERRGIAGASRIDYNPRFDSVVEYKGQMDARRNA